MSNVEKVGAVVVICLVTMVAVESAKKRGYGLDRVAP